MCAGLTRPLGTFEHFLWATDKWTPRHFAVVLRIEGELSPTLLEEALAKAQRRHPALRVSVHAETFARPRFVNTHASVPFRLITRDGDNRWLLEAQAELIRPFSPEVGPLLRCALVHGGTVSEIILVVYHAIGDGISATYLLRDLLQAMQGKALAYLPPRASLEELLVGQRTLPSVSLSRPTEVKLHRPGQPLLSTFEIEPRQTQAILSRCKEERTTLQGALIAAAMISLDRPIVRCLAPINLRRLCPPIRDDFGLYISSGMTSFNRAGAVDFWSLARQSRAQLITAFETQLLWARFARLASLLASTHDPQSVYQAYRQSVMVDVVLSNIGTFSATDQTPSLRVIALYLLLNTELEPSIAIATAEDRMCVTITLNALTRPMWVARFENLIRTAATLATC